MEKQEKQHPKPKATSATQAPTSSADVITEAPSPAYHPGTNMHHDISQLPAPAPVLAPATGDRVITELPPAYYQGMKQPNIPGQSLVPAVTPINMLQGENSQWIDCPFCNQRAPVLIGKEGTPMQWLTGLVCCLVCVCLACVPCLAGWFEETLYTCSKCHKMVAKRDDHGLIQVFGPTVLVPSQHP